MNFDKIIVELSAKEIDAIHYVLDIGIRSFNRKPIASMRDYIIICDDIKKQLPTKLNLEQMKR